jgi:zinc and cadmium transporter
MTLPYILLSVIAVSLISLIGALFIKNVNRVLALVAFAAGALLGSAFLHLLPEAIEAGSMAFVWVLAGILTFFILERFLHWHHHHNKGCVHPFTWLILIGDGIHNLIDGVIIAATWLANPLLGLTTTVAVIAHEIPQEIGDFAILLYGGFSKRKALFWNFASAITAIFGALLMWAFSFYTNISLFTPFTAGGFIYIATSDLIPEMHKEINIKRSVAELILFLIGIVVMVGLGFFKISIA